MLVLLLLEALDGRARERRHGAGGSSGRVRVLLLECALRVICRVVVRAGLRVALALVAYL